MPGLFPYLKMEIDNDHDRRGRFILTGSTQFAITWRLTESLAGRIGLLALLPLEYAELSVAANWSWKNHGTFQLKSVRFYRHLHYVKKWAKMNYLHSKMGLESFSANSLGWF